MEEALDFQDWELLLSPTPSPAAAGGGGEDEDAGAIKHDYFELGSDAKYPKRASFAKESEEGEEDDFLAASGNPSWVDPGPDRLAFPDRSHAALWSDTSSDGERRELEAVGQVEQQEEGEVVVAKEEEEEEEEEGKEMVGKRGGGGGVVGWWKLPFEMVRLWALRAARHAWSVPVAVAVLGIAMLGRRLYRMRRQSKAIARFKLVLDEKKTSQFKAQAPHLNESVSMVRRAPIIKPSLPANGVTPWPVLGYL